MKAMGSLLLYLLFFGFGSAQAQNAQIHYTMANVEVFGEVVTADLVSQYSNGHTEVVSLLVEGSVVTSAGSPFTPAVSGGRAVGTITPMPRSPRMPTPSEREKVGPAIMVIPALTCMAKLGYTRSKCTSDCSDQGGVNDWNSGVCGSWATCTCKNPPPPPPPPGCATPGSSLLCQGSWPTPAAWKPAFNFTFSPFVVQHQNELLKVQGFQAF